MNAIRTMSPEGRADLERIEQCALVAYWDKLHWSIGFGHAVLKSDPVWDANGKPTLPITRAQADDWLTLDLRVYESCVNSCVRVPLTQAQFDALVDFAYNEGTGAFAGSTLLRLLNGGDYQGAADHLLEWDKDMQRGALVVDDGLLARRKFERAKFLGSPPAAA